MGGLNAEVPQRCTVQLVYWNHCAGPRRGPTAIARVTILVSEHHLGSKVFVRLPIVVPRGVKRGEMPVARG